MSDPLTLFDSDIPHHYDEGLGPVLFVPYAHDLATRIAKDGGSPKILLELAAGTGILTRTLARALPETTVLASDLNVPMLEIAQRRLAGIGNVRFAPADAMSIGLGDGSVDAMACQFGVMFFPDKVASFREARRVLKPGAPYWFNSWAGHDDNPFGRLAYEVTADLYSDNPPLFYRLPFSYPDPDRIVSDLKAAGFTSIEFETVRFDQPVEDWNAFSRGIVYGNPLHAEIMARSGPGPEEVLALIERRLEGVLGPAPSSMPLAAHVVRAA